MYPRTGARSRKVTAILLRASSWINRKLISEVITATPRTFAPSFSGRPPGSSADHSWYRSEWRHNPVAGRGFETLDHFGKNGFSMSDTMIPSVRCRAKQGAGMNVREVSETLDGREH